MQQLRRACYHTHTGRDHPSNVFGILLLSDEQVRTVCPASPVLKVAMFRDAELPAWWVGLGCKSE